MDPSTLQLLDHEVPPPKPRWRQRIERILRELIWTALLVGLVLMVVSSLRGGLQLPEIAPDFRTTSLDGKAVELSKMRGQPVVLYFWATWCSACKITSPTVEQFAANHPNVHVIGVAMQQEEEVRAQLGDNKRSFAIVPVNAEILEHYPVRSLPTTVAIDAQGKVLWSRQGVLLPGELNWHMP